MCVSFFCIGRMNKKKSHCLSYFNKTSHIYPDTHATDFFHVYTHTLTSIHTFFSYISQPCSSYVRKYHVYECVLYTHYFFFIVKILLRKHTRKFCPYVYWLWCLIIIIIKMKRKREIKKQVLYKRAHVLVHICIFNIESDSTHALERERFWVRRFIKFFCSLKSFVFICLSRLYFLCFYV